MKAARPAEGVPLPGSVKAFLFRIEHYLRARVFVVGSSYADGGGDTLRERSYSHGYRYQILSIRLDRESGTRLLHPGRV